MLPKEIGQCRRRIQGGRGAQRAIVVAKQDAELGLADAGRVRQYGLEHRLQLAWRAADDLQHVRGRGLLLQRLGEVVGALAQLVEQPGVLDRDDGLGREVGHQLGLLVGEWTHFLAIDDKGADQLVLVAQRHGNK
jgi:hypothetical protein